MAKRKRRQRKSKEKKKAQAIESNEGFWRGVFSNTKKKAATDIDMYDRFPTLYKEGMFGQPNQDQKSHRVSANFVFSYINMTSALLHSNSPAIRVETKAHSASAQKDFGPLVQAQMFPSVQAAQEEFSKVLRQLEEYAYNETSTHIHNDALIFETLCRGSGISKVSFDPITKTSRVDTFKRHEIFIDPTARYAISQGQYVIQESIMGIESARTFFRNFGVSAEKIQPNYTLGEGRGRDEAAKKANFEGHSHQDLFKFYEVWFKDGDKARRLMYRHYDKDSWITTEPLWPFEFDNDQFPYDELSFYRQYGEAGDSFPALYAVEGLRMAYEKMIEFFHRHTLRSIAKKVFVDNKMLDDTFESKIKSAEDMTVIPIDVKDGNIRNAVHVQSFNDANDGSLESASVMKGIRDEILGSDELLRGGNISGRISATEAEVRDENTKMRTSKMQKTLDTFHNSQLSKRIQVDRQLVSPEKIAQIAGPMGAILWQVHAGNQSDIINEYSVKILAGSTSERAKRKRMENLNLIFQNGMTINQAAGGLPIFDLKEVAMDMAEVAGEENISKYINEDIAQLAMQMATQPPPPEEGAPI